MSSSDRIDYESLAQRYWECYARRWGGDDPAKGTPDPSAMVRRLKALRTEGLDTECAEVEEEIYSILVEGGNAAVELILALSHEAENDARLGYLGAGWVETFVGWHGVEARLALEATGDEAVGVALKSVRPDSDPEMDAVFGPNDPTSLKRTDS